MRLNPCRTREQDEPTRLTCRLERNPFNNWLGLRIVALTADQLTLTMPWREEIVSNPDRRYVHGGVLAAVIDTAGSFAIAARTGAPPQTVDMRVDYHKAAKQGSLNAVGRVIRLGRTLGTAEASILDADGALLATGRGVYFVANAVY